MKPIIYYEDIVTEFLKSNTQSSSYYSGIIQKDNWTFTISCVLYDNDIVPIWWEFYTEDDNGNVLPDDFSFDEFKKVYLNTKRV